MEARRRQTVVQSGLVYRLTGSSALPGLAGFSSRIPVLLLVLLGGSVAGGMTVDPRGPSTVLR